MKKSKKLIKRFVLAIFSMNKNESLRAIARLVLAIFILSIATVIFSGKPNWTPVMTFLSGYYLYRYCSVNDDKKWLFFKPKKKARRAGTQASHKVIDFEKLTKSIIRADKEVVKCSTQIIQWQITELIQH